MIPLRDENPTRTVSWVVYAILALNIAAYIYNGPLTEEARNPLRGFELVALELTSGRTVIPSPVPPWMTILTSMFLHANLLHIGGNMLYLWIFGNNIEDTLGHVKFLFFYLASGAVAALAQVAMNPQSPIPMVGASGAIAGVLGAYLVLFPRARVISLLIIVYFIRVIALPASFVLGFWIVLQVLNAVMFHSGMFPGGGVAYAAHVGGFVAGVALILLFGGRRLLGGRRPVVYRRNSW